MTAYPFVQARYFGRSAIVQVRALVWHMAEGAGTVSWLHNGPYKVVNGVRVGVDNSSSFVIELTGRIVQMVGDHDADHSLHWDIAHWSSPTCGVFSAAAARALLGTDGTRDPLRYVKSIELEGYAAAGPNARQIESMVALTRELRGRFPTIKGNLGHRDFMGYKACPGCKLPWARIGGHGRFTVTPAPPAPTPAEDDAMFEVPTSSSVLAIPTDVWIYVHSDFRADPGNVQIAPGRDLPLVGLTPQAWIVGYRPAASSSTTPRHTYYVKRSQVPGPPKVAPVDSSAFNAGVTAAGTAASTAINGVKRA